MRWTLCAFGIITAALVYAQPMSERDWEGEEQVLRGLNLPTKGAALLQIFRERTPKPDTVEQFNRFAGRLGAATFTERTKASSDLQKMGPVIRPLLEALIADGKHDLETKRRLEQILEAFPADKDIAAISSASRLLQRDKPAGRLEVLFEYVPHALNESMRQDVQLAITDAALENKAPSDLLLKMLKDANPAKRAAAAEGLVRSIGPAAARRHLTGLMKDESPLVRYQLGIALVEKHDKAGLPLLVETIAKDHPERAEYAVELLYRAAGESAPNDYYQGKKNAEKVAAAWQKWLVKNEADLDLSKLLERTDLGYTVVTLMSTKGLLKSKVMEFGPRPQNAVRWEFDAGRYALDVQVVGPNRLLMAEYTDRRVTERNFKGEILKQITVNTLPIACQRLPNEQTLIVTRNQILIYDGDGKQTQAWQPQQNPIIISAQRAKNGQTAVITSGGVCMLLDPQFKEIKRINVGNVVSVLGANLELLPNGRVLVPLYQQNQIAEFDWTGNKVWSAQAKLPLSVTRLSNGNTLMLSATAPYRVVEMDRDGREVWSVATDGRPIRARRR